MRRRYKVLLLLLLPLVIIIGGAYFEIPHTGKIGLFIFGFYIILGILYGEDKMEGKS